MASGARFLREMELDSVDCRDCGPQWVIQDDLGRVFVSTRTLAKALGVKKPAKLTETLQRNGASLLDRNDFPERFLGLGREAKVHNFAMLAELPRLLMVKHLTSVCTILACVEAELGRRHVACAAELEALKLGPRRSLDNAKLPVESLRKRPKSNAQVVADLDLNDAYSPAPANVVAGNREITVPLGLFPGGVRIAFAEMDFGTPSGGGTPFDGGKLAPTAQSTMELRVEPRKSLGFEEALQRSPPSRKIGFQDQSVEANNTYGPIYQRALEERGVVFDDGVPAVPLPVFRPPNKVGPMASRHKIAELSFVIDHLGHTVEYISGSKIAASRFSWKIRLNFRGFDAPVRSAFEFFRLDKGITMWSEGYKEKRRWFMSSDCVASDELAALAKHLFEDPLPHRPIHEDFSSDLCQQILRENPWILEPGTTLSEPVHPFYGGDERLVFVSLSGLKNVFEAGHTHSCRKPKLSVEVSTAGVAAQLQVACACGTTSIQLHPEDSTTFNRTVFVAKEMSGRPSAVNRFLSWLGVCGTIISHDANGSLKEPLRDATQIVCNICEDTVASACILSKNMTVCADVVHKRMAKHGSVLGESYNSAVTFGDPRLGRPIAVFETDRRELQKQRRERGKILLKSLVEGGRDLVSTIGGVEHYTFDLGLQHLVQLTAVHLERAKARLGPEQFSLCDWGIKTMVLDTLSSGPNTVKRVFEAYKLPVPVLRNDWWHKRKSFGKLVADVEGKKHDEKAKYPQFAGLGEATSSVFSDSLFQKLNCDRFVAAFTHAAEEAGVIKREDMDKNHGEAWDKLLKSSSALFEKIDVDDSTSVNELFHAHIRFYCIKGDKMSPRHWKTLLMFAFLSFNKFPEWPRRVLKEFLRITKK